MEPYNVGIWLSLINFILALIRTITSLTKPPVTILSLGSRQGKTKDGLDSPQTERREERGNTIYNYHFAKFFYNLKNTSKTVYSVFSASLWFSKERKGEIKRT